MVAMVVVLINEQTLNSVGKCSVLELVFGGEMLVVRCWYHVSPQWKWWQTLNSVERRSVLMLAGVLDCWYHSGNSDDGGGVGDDFSTFNGQTPVVGVGVGDEADGAVDGGANGDDGGGGNDGASGDDGGGVDDDVDKL